MPTGYTYIIDERDVDFPTFLWRCVRAMGVCIMQRDEDMDAPARDREPSTYYADSFRKASERYAELRDMTDEQAATAALKEYDDTFRKRDEEAAKYAEVAARYAKMRGQVETWAPPTADHFGLRAFMLEQLKIGAPSDISDYYKAERMTGAAWRAARMAEARAKMDRAAVEAEKEAERCRTANEWLRRLRESVPQPQPQPKAEGSTDD